MRGSTFITVPIYKFQEFILECLKKHNASQALTDSLIYHRFHQLDSFKKQFINEILNNYYGIHYVGLVPDTHHDLLYKLQVTDKKLCTFFLLKYAN